MGFSLASSMYCYVNCTEEKVMPLWLVWSSLERKHLSTANILKHPVWECWLTCGELPLFHLKKNQKTCSSISVLLSLTFLLKTFSTLILTSQEWRNKNLWGSFHSLQSTWCGALHSHKMLYSSSGVVEFSDQFLSTSIIFTPVPCCMSASLFLFSTFLPKFPVNLISLGQHLQLMACFCLFFLFF